MTEDKQVVVVARAGPGIGTARARRLAGGGYVVALLARDRGRVDASAAAIPDTRGCDVSGPACVTAALDTVRAEFGEVEARPFGRTW